MFNNTEQLKFAVQFVFSNLRRAMPQAELHVITDLQISHVEGVMTHANWKI